MTTTTRIEPEHQIGAPRVQRSPDETPSWFARVTARPRAIVGAGAAIAAAWSLLGSRFLFPYLSNNHDEAVYLLQANALEHGHLFPKAGAEPSAFLPWLTAQEGHHFIPKYAPVFPMMLAFGKWIFTTERAAIAVIAASVIVMVYLLATEILEDRRQAALASVFMLATPLFIVQSATFLPYSAQLLLLTSFAFALLRGLRTRRAGWLVLSGTLVGLAFFARPYDTMLFALPLTVYLVVRYRHDLRVLAQRIGWIVLGGVPPAILMLLFDKAATGSALDSPFSLIDSRDTIGFGSRSMDPSNPAVKYTPGLGWTGLSRHVMLTMFWVFGGLVLVGCAIFFLVRKQWRGQAVWVGSIAVVLPIGYLFFWGTYGAAVWGAPWYLGPYYYMPVFAPTVILGAGGFALFLHEFRRVSVWALVGMLMLSGFVVGKAMVENWGFTRDDQRLNTALDHAHVHDALVFLPGYYGPRVLHPFAIARNNWNATGDVLYAVDRGDAENAKVIAAYASRTPYKLNVHGTYRQTPYDTHLYSTLDPVTTARGTNATIAVDFRAPSDGRMMAVTVRADGRNDTFVVDTNARPNKRERLVLHVTSTATTAEGHVVSHSSARSTPDGQLQLEIGSAPNARTLPATFYVRRFGMLEQSNQLLFITPGDETLGPGMQVSFKLAVR